MSRFRHWGANRRQNRGNDIRILSDFLGLVCSFQWNKRSIVIVYLDTVSEVSRIIVKLEVSFRQMKVATSQKSS